MSRVLAAAGSTGEALTGLPFADRIAAAALIGKPAALIADAGRAERLVA